MNNGNENNNENEDKSEKRLSLVIKNLLNKVVKRRTFLKNVGITTAATAATVTSVAALKKSDPSFFEDFFTKHYKEMTEKDKKRVFEKIKKNIKSKYNVDTNISDPLPQEGVKNVFCLSLSACTGTRKCVTACAEENNIPPEIGSYIKVLEMPIGTLNPENGDLFYEGKVPKEDKFYLPVQCNQCDNPPCVKVCPVEATWKEVDGIVVIDYDWCVGCRYCQTACPYEARHFNFMEPNLEPENINPDQSYLSNRIRSKGVMEKCTFCLHKTRIGEYPACLEACPTGARKFGNILDPESEVSQIFKHKKVFVLKEELNTIPQFFYYFD